MNQPSKSRLIIALDFADAAQAKKFIAGLSPQQCRFKIGKELFTASGPELVKECVARGFDVFLDLKYHDIPNTVAQACQAAANLGVWMLNVHISGGSKMLKAAAEAIARFNPRPILIGVTVLTSFNQATADEIGLTQPLNDIVLRMAHLAQQTGLDGVVCSGREVTAIRQQCGKSFCLVTPGIRLAGDQVHDQQRTMTPAEAIAAGADYLVVGRTITLSENPHKIIERILADIQQATIV